MIQVLKYKAEGNRICPEKHFNALPATAVRVCLENPTPIYIPLV